MEGEDGMKNKTVLQRKSEGTEKKQEVKKERDVIIKSSQEEGVEV